MRKSCITAFKLVVTPNKPSGNPHGYWVSSATPVDRGFPAIPPLEAAPGKALRDARNWICAKLPKLGVSLRPEIAVNSAVNFARQFLANPSIRNRVGKSYRVDISQKLV
jgi:hypothetical protein